MLNFKVIASIGVSLLTIAGIGSYEFYIKDKALSMEVVVAKEKIEKHTDFSQSNLVIERRKKTDLIEGYITPDEIGSLYGRDTNALILANQVISKEFVEFQNLTPDPSKNEAIRPIPSDWIYAMPGSLRRKDTITIYPVKDKKASVEGIQSVQVIDASTENKNDEEKEMSEEDAANASPEEIASRFEPILENIAVSYVKTSSNQEVTSKDGTQERFDASGTASGIEVNIKEEDLKRIVQFIDKGYKLYISYR